MVLLKARSATILLTRVCPAYNSQRRVERVLWQTKGEPFVGMKRKRARNLTPCEDQVEEERNVAKGEEGKGRSRGVARRGERSVAVGYTG